MKLFDFCDLIKNEADVQFCPLKQIKVKLEAGSLCFSSVCRFILIYFVLWLHLEFLSYRNVSSCLFGPNNLC